MLGVIVLIILLGVELGFVIASIVKRSYLKKEKSVSKIVFFALGLFLVLIGVIQWSFRWYILFLILFIRAITGLWYLFKNSNKNCKTFKAKYGIPSLMGYAFVILFAVLPAIIFPQFHPVKPTGSYKVATVSYTLTDPGRIETFNDRNENRKVTIQFWYPENADGKFPLAVFSHGAFGYRGSNRSTYINLASNGYVVCSIDHTYHAFFTKQTDGKMIIVNQKFIHDAMAATNDDYDAQKTYELSQVWLKLRTDDVNFVLNDILGKAGKANSEHVYQLIDTDKIGLFGHSIGGATAAEIGRERKDIDAVIVIDGTMLGEEIGFENGKTVLNKEPYPVPILNIYNEEHYKDALKNASTYDNMVASANAIDSRQVVVKGAGHLNFTDLPLFSPFLASVLGTGEVDSRYCIETTNQIVLSYFNYYLKNAKELNLQAEY